MDLSDAFRGRSYRRYHRVFDDMVFDKQAPEFGEEVCL